MARRDVVIHAVGEEPSWTTGPSFLTGIHSSGRYFVDQNGAPFLIRGDTPWSIMPDLSTSQMSTYVTRRASDGINSLYFSSHTSDTNGGQASNCRTYDNVLPFVGGNITQLNDTYWDREEYLVDLCRQNGITCWLNIYDGWTDVLMGGASNSEYQSFGTAIANRLAAYPNIVWMFGGDYFPNTTSATNPDSYDEARYYIMQGVRSTGDTRPYSVQLGYERSLTSNNLYWKRHAEANFAYTYFATYDAVLAGYAMSWDTAAGKPATRPVYFGEGEYDGYNGGGSGNAITIRKQVAWTMTSGGCGTFTGQETVWEFASGWENELNHTQIIHYKALLDVFEGIEWWKLVPDTGSALVTAGRGTKYTFTSQNDNVFNVDNNYVTAGVAADGTLAVIYMPAASSTITVSWTPMNASGRTATWVDPTNGSTVAATAGATSYSRSTANAAGAADWLLILRAS